MRQSTGVWVHINLFNQDNQKKTFFQRWFEWSEARKSTVLVLVGLLRKDGSWLLRGDLSSAPARMEDARAFCFGEAPSVSTWFANGFLKLGSLRT